jgi:hypothetical protein
VHKVSVRIFIGYVIDSLGRIPDEVKRSKWLFGAFFEERDLT